jgi:DNA-binding transcriptional LysR family regulator
MLDPHRLRVLRAVVAAGSIRGAAHNLGYTPSAISQHLAGLQKDTGLALVDRAGRGIRPTEAGRALAAGSGAALERLAALDALVTDLREGRVGRFRLSYFASAGAALMPTVVAALTGEFPQLRLDLRLIEMAESSFVPDVEVFVEHAASSPLDGYDVETLVDDPYVAVVPDGHARSRADAVRLVDLRDEVWVENDLVRGPCRQIVMDACAAQGFTPTFQIEAQDYPSAIAFVAAGVGITVVPRLAALVLPAGVRAVPVVDPAPQRRIQVRARRAVGANPVVARTLQLLREESRVVARAGGR